MSADVNDAREDEFGPLNRPNRTIGLMKRAGSRDLLLRVAGGLLVGMASFVVLGSVAAIWENPFFVRMTPVQGFEIALLGAMSALFGVYVIVRRPTCGYKFSGLAGVVGFIGIACPICNKILLVVFGAEALMLYLEPSRLWFSLAGVAMAGGAVARELWKRRERPHGTMTNKLDTDRDEPIGET